MEEKRATIASLYSPWRFKYHKCFLSNIAKIMNICFLPYPSQDKCPIVGAFVNRAVHDELFLHPSFEPVLMF